MPGKMIMVLSFGILTGAVILGGCASQESPVAGVITEPNQLSIGQAVPDFPVVTTNGKETRFSEIREPTAIVAFVSPAGDQCCWLNPGLVSLAQEVEHRPISVTQISEPTDRCPHGPGCVASCDLKDTHLMSLCDAERRAWNAYREPKANTVVLINYRGEVAMVAPLTKLDAVARKARELAAEYEAWWRTAYEG